MNNYQHYQARVPWNTFAVAMFALLPYSISQAQSTSPIAETFIEPYRTIIVPAPEIGTIAEIYVEEGQQVAAGHVLAKLDDSVLQKSLAIAKSAMTAQGNRRAAAADVSIYRRQFESLQQLFQRGSATQRELDRAMAETELAQARLDAVDEQLELRKLEYERTLAQIEQRVLKSPIDGVISEIEKEVGEFVSPTDPRVLTVVQLNPAKADFSIAIGSSRSIRQGQKIELLVGEQRQRVVGIVDFKSPTADPKSGTVRIKIKIPNESGQILSGSLCRWDISGASQDGLASEQRSPRRVANTPNPRSSR